jgi:hypothetical protein
MFIASWETYPRGDFHSLERRALFTGSGVTTRSRSFQGHEALPPERRPMQAFARGRIYTTFVLPDAGAILLFLAGHFGSGETRFAVLSFRQRPPPRYHPGVTHLTGEFENSHASAPVAFSGISVKNLIVGAGGSLKMRGVRLDTTSFKHRVLALNRGGGAAIIGPGVDRTRKKPPVFSNRGL